MIHAIRKLARVIHRRSVWQVVGAYVVLAWLALAAVRWTTRAAGLPTWTPAMAWVLAVVLFPLVVATAVVQEGLPGLRIQDEVDPNELEGRTPEEVHVIPEAHPLYGVGLLTWRNTILGAVSSAVLLVASVVAYISMWALGIGPVGSLQAQGLISEGDSVLVAAFENDTDDPSMGALVADLFERDLSRTRAVVVVARDAVGPSLVDRTDERLDALLARRIASERGYRAVVAGDVERRRDGYRVSVRIILADGGATVGGFSESYPAEDGMVEAVARLAERVRLKLGESLRQIRQEESAPVVGTSSSEAMELYGMAGRAADRGDDLAALDLLERAVRLDPGFALAWRKLGVLRDQAADTAAALDAYQRAVGSWNELVPGGHRTTRELTERITALER